MNSAGITEMLDFQPSIMFDKYSSENSSEVLGFKLEISKCAAIILNWF